MSRSVDVETKIIARFMPGGKAWITFRIVGHVANLILRGMAKENIRVYDTINLLFDSIPDETELFLDEWESALKIPDECFREHSNPIIRRRNIVIKLASLGVQTPADFVTLAALFGLSIEVNSGIDHVPPGDGGYGTASPPFAIPADFADVKTARNTIVIRVVVPADLTFPLDFPIPFTNPSKEEMECLFTKLKPATNDIIVIEV